MVPEYASRAYILWMGNQMAGREMSQKRKKHIKSRVFIPAEGDSPFARLEEKKVSDAGLKESEGLIRMCSTEGHMALSIVYTHVPPMDVWTPYHILRHKTLE